MDELTAASGDAGFICEQVDKINVNEFSTYIAVECRIAHHALRKLT